MSELTDLSLSEVSDMLEAGTVSSLELVEANLRAIERTESKVHAYASVLAEAALDAAPAADKAIAAGERRVDLFTVYPSGSRTTFTPKESSPRAARR